MFGCVFITNWSFRPNLKKEIEKYKQQLGELQNKQNNHERNVSYDPIM